MSSTFLIFPPDRVVVPYGSGVIVDPDPAQFVGNEFDRTGKLRITGPFGLVEGVVCQIKNPYTGLGGGEQNYIGTDLCHIREFFRMILFRVFPERFPVGVVFDDHRLPGGKIDHSARLQRLGELVVAGKPRFFCVAFDQVNAVIPSGPDFVSGILQDKAGMVAVGRKKGVAPSVFAAGNPPAIVAVAP